MYNNKLLCLILLVFFVIFINTGTVFCKRDSDYVEEYEDEKFQETTELYEKAKKNEALRDAGKPYNPLYTRSKPSDSKNNTFTIIVLIVLIVAFIAYRKRQKSKQKTAYTAFTKQSPDVSQKDSTVEERLEKLISLYESGAISENEYSSCRNEIIKSI
jgi:uncharacterized protein YpmS